MFVKHLFLRRHGVKPSAFSSPAVQGGGALRRVGSEHLSQDIVLADLKINLYCE